MSILYGHHKSLGVFKLKAQSDIALPKTRYSMEGCATFCYFERSFLVITRESGYEKKPSECNYIFKTVVPRWDKNSLLHNIVTTRFPSSTTRP